MVDGWRKKHVKPQGKRTQKKQKHRCKKRRRRPDKPGYQSDVTDCEWELIRDMIPDEVPGGRPRAHGKGALLNGILYVLRTGCQWRMLPKDLPPWQTVYYYFRRWGQEGVISRIHTVLREAARKQAEREATPSALIIDGQSVKTTSKEGPVATMPARRSKVESAISSWIRKDGYGDWMFTKGIFKTGMAHSSPCRKLAHCPGWN